MPWSPSQAVIDWSQFLSAIFSAVAIVVAFFAIWKSDRDIARERRTVHELEVLRDLSADIEGVDEELIPRLRCGLLLLPGESDFPMLRAAVDARATGRDIEAFRARYPRAGPIGLVGFHMTTKTAAGLRHQRFELLRDDGTAADELERAIQRRLPRSKTKSN